MSVDRKENKNLRKRNIMRVKEITNVSKSRVVVVTTKGTEISLPPQESFEHVDVTNLTELGEKVKYVADLTEVGKNDKKKYGILHS